MRDLRPRIPTLLLTILSLAVVGCATLDTQASPSTHRSLYDRLGGKRAITAVIDQFVANVASDKRISDRFATTDIPRLKTNLVGQVCAASGGPCRYTGRDMKTTHAGMKITTADFNALVEDLIASLDKLKVPAAEKKELLGIFGPMKRDIVELP